MAKALNLSDGRPLTARVAMLVHAFYLRDPRVRREAECLAAAGAEVHVFGLQQGASAGGPLPKSEQVNGVTIHRLPITRKRGGKGRYLFEFVATTLLGGWAIGRRHLRKRFDVVHVHNMPDFLVYAGVLPKWLGAKVILDIHDPMVEQYQTTYELPDGHKILRAVAVQQRLSYKRADQLITVNRPMRENVAKTAPSDTDIAVIHNFPDPAVFAPVENLARWPRHDGQFVVIYSGTVNRNTRVDVAVRAVAKAAEIIPNIRLRILGDGNRLEECFQLARELGIEDRVERLAPVPITEVPGVMAAADVGISPHQAGPFGDLCLSTKVLEFMTQGLPVVCSRTRTLIDYVPDDATFYFEPANADEAAAQLVRMWQEPDTVRQTLAHTAAVVDTCSWEREKAHLVALYQKLLGQQADAS